MIDAESSVLITTDAYYRSGKLLDHEQAADTAAELAEKGGQKIAKVLVWQRYPGKYSSPTPLVEGRDFLVNDMLKGYRGEGKTGGDAFRRSAFSHVYQRHHWKTQGVPARRRRLPLLRGGHSKYVQDIHPSDVYWCMADIGWITGHSYIVYGPLLLGASVVVYEGVPTWPDAGRPWRIAEELDVNIFHTSPTAIRALRRAGPDEPASTTTTSS